MTSQTPSSSEETLSKDGRDALAEVAQAYASRRSELAKEDAELGQRSARVSGLRGVTFVAAAALITVAVLGSVSPTLQPMIIGAAVVLAGAFVVLVIVHALLITKEEALRQRTAIVDQAIARISTRPKRSAASETSEPDASPQGKRSNASSPRFTIAAPADHPYAKDLDIFGERDRSLFETIDVTQTDPGASTLASWLAAPAKPTEIAERQDAVQELAPMRLFREDLAVEGVRAESRGRPVAPLITWAEAPLVFTQASDDTKGSQPRKRALLIAAGLLVVMTVVFLTLDQVFGAQLLGPFRRVWLVSFIAQLAILGALNKEIAPLLTSASSKQAPFGRYRALFACIERQNFKAPRLQQTLDVLRGKPGSREEASAAMHSLETIIGYTDLRNSGFVYLFINALLLWDVWCAIALDRWRAHAGRHVRGWFKALGEIESFSSLATFAYERPDHTFPVVLDGPPTFAATALGHPMLPFDVRVPNDVAFNKPGDALLITGSNMSGKSTILRAIGVNAVLAQAGAPVCAKHLRMSPLVVHTSMRIDDSLDQGISHFYAELSRLKSVVDAAKAGAPVLFLLDEILHGTNSRERHIGAKAVVLHLLDRGAIGALSSHDLALADLAEASSGRVSIVHFEEIIRDGRMAFDYTLKPGVVTTTNALRLMRLVGLDIPPQVETLS